MIWWWSVPFPSDVKIDSNVTHFHSDGVIPKGVAILLFKCHGFLHCLWALYTKFNRPIDILLCIALLHIRDNHVLSPQHMIFPPVESWLNINILQY